MRGAGGGGEGWRLTSSPRFLVSDACQTLIMCIVAISPNIASDSFKAARSYELHDTVSEPRRWTRNPLGSARRGSNPLGVVTPWTVKKTRKRCNALCASRPTVRTSSVRPPLPPTHPSAASSFIPMRRLLRHRFQCSAMSVFWCPPISPPFSPHSSCFRPHHVPSPHIATLIIPSHFLALK